MWFFAGERNGLRGGPGQGNCPSRVDTVKPAADKLSQPPWRVAESPARLTRRGGARLAPVARVPVSCRPGRHLRYWGGFASLA